MANITHTHSPVSIPQAALSAVWDAIFPHRHIAAERSAVDWTPARASWPSELRELHAAVVGARVTWNGTLHASQDAPEDRALAQAATLAMLSYIAIEHYTAERIAAWQREHPEPAQVAETVPASHQSTQDVRQDASSDGELIPLLDALSALTTSRHIAPHRATRTEHRLCHPSRCD